MNQREIKNFTYADWIRNGGERCIFDANQMASQNSKTFQGGALPVLSITLGMGTDILLGLSI